jgi:hypothetical protein
MRIQRQDALSSLARFSLLFWDGSHHSGRFFRLSTSMAELSSPVEVP